MIKINSTIYQDRDIINRYISIPALLSAEGVYIQPNKMLHCPFIENHARMTDKKPSAKYHQDIDGDKLWCFVCNRQYRPWDLVEKYNISIKDLRVQLKDALEGKNIDIEVNKKKEFKKMDFSYLKGFKEKEFNFDKAIEYLYLNIQKR